MRILMLSQFYPPVVGGEEQHVRILSQALAARGHQVAVATIANDGRTGREMDGDVTIYRIRISAQRISQLYTDPERRHAPPFPDPEAMRNLLKIVRAERPQIVHAHNWLVHAYLPLKRLTSARLVVTLHDYSLTCAQKRLMEHGEVCTGPALLKCLACAGDHYGRLRGAGTVLSNRVMGTIEKQMVDIFLPVSRAVAIGNGLIESNLPFKIIPNFLAEHTLDPAVNVADYVDRLPPEYMLFVGDLTHDKGIHVLLDAYSRLSGAPPLVLIGRLWENKLPALPENVLPIGRWPNAAVLEAWRRCLFGLVPSVWAEPFGMVAIEAMAGGRPVIASRVGGLADIVVDGATGLLVEPGNGEALSEAIAHLLVAPRLREQMGKAASRRANHYRASTVVPRIEDVYEALLALEADQRLTVYEH